MTVTKINPDNVVLNQVDGYWMKLCAMLLWKLSPDKPVDITVKDFDEAAKFDELPTVLVHGHHDSISLALITKDRAEQIAQYDKELREAQSGGNNH
jgi:hypothetical protein